MAKEIAFNIKITGSKDVLDIQNRIKALKSELAKSEDPAFIKKASEDLAKLGVQLKEAQRQARLTQADLTAKDTTISSYSRLSAQLVLARERFKELAAGGKASAKDIEAARKEAAGLDAQLKRIDANTGVFGRNVGNYAGSLKGLFGQLKGALAQTALVGNIRNIPQLFGMISGGIEAAAKAYDDYKDATDAAYAVNKKINKAIDENIEAFAKETSELQTVFETAKDTTAGTEEHATAIAAINEKYGEYLPNLLTENSTLAEIEEAQAAATNALIDNTIAKIKNAAATEIITNLFKEQLKVQRAETAQSQGGFINFFNDLTGQNDLAVELLKQNVEKTKGEFGLLGGAIGGLKKSLQDLSKEDVSFAELLGGGSTEGEKKVIKAAKEAQEKAGEATRKAAEKEQERIRKQQEDFAKDDAKFIIDRAKAASDLSQQVRKLVVEGIEDDGERARAQEMLNFELLQAQRKADLAEVIALYQAQNEKIKALFGENSAELLAFTTKTEQELAALQAQYNQLSEAEAVIHQQKLTEIDKQGQEERAQEEEEAFKARIAAAETANEELSNSYTLQLSELKTRLAKGLIDLAAFAQEAYDIERKAKEDQIQLIQDRIEQGLFASEQERQQLIIEAQELNQALAELEQDRTKKVVEESEKQNDARRKTIEFALNSISSVLDAGQKLSDAVLAIEEARLQKQLDFRTQNIANLQASLENQSGLEAAFTQQRIDRETIAARKIEQQQMQARKRAAIANKAFAVGQAAINVALGVTAALTLPPPVSFITAALTAVLGAVEIATIIATPLKFAKGGFTGSGFGGVDETGFRQAGIVHEGEYVVPKYMVDSPQFAPIIQGLEANRTGFAAGGFTAPNFAARPNITTQSNDMMQLLMETNALARKTAQDLREVKFVVTPNTKEAMDNDTREVNFIKRNQIL